jgi:hypothetical protein
MNLSAILRPYKGADVIERLLRQKWATCEVVDLSALKPAVRPFYLEGSDKHQELMLISASYINSTGRTACFRGEYGGGVCDVFASDRSLFVECGNLTGGGSEKVLSTLIKKQVVMVVPYRQRPQELKGYTFSTTESWPRTWPSTLGFHLEIRDLLAAAEAREEDRMGHITAIAVRRADFAFRTRNRDLVAAMSCDCRCLRCRSIPDNYSIELACTVGGTTHLP